MEKEQWTSKNNQQAVAMDLEETDDYLNNGITNILETNNANIGIEKTKNKTQSDADRNNKIQQVVEAAVSEVSRKTIENILEQVKTLTPTEHLLLYLKLPTEYSNAGDPLRQPLNPLGSRSEISQTIMWIKTHLEEDPELSLPKQDVYNEYYCFCGPNKIKPLSTADFGKVMKQVYPRVRPRRLGTRGKSRYCYAGLRRRLKLDSPILPDLSEKPLSSEVSCSSADLVAAAWAIVKEWSEHQLGLQFPSLQALACYLVLNLSIGNGTSAANHVVSAAKTSFKGDSISTNIGCGNKHKETQLQLQRKLQQKSELHKEQKRKMQQLQSPKIEHKTRSKKFKPQPRSATVSPLNASPTAVSSDINISPSQGLQPVCDKSIDFANLQTLPDFSSFHKTVNPDQISEYTNEMQKHNSEITGEFVTKSNAVGKLPIPRLNNNLSKFFSAASPKKGKNAKYKAIQPKLEPCDLYNPQIGSAADNRSNQTVVDNHTSTSNKIAIKKEKAIKKLVQDTYKSDIDNNLISLDVDTDVSLPRERLISIANMDKSALDDYLGTNNSQENEEELVKYFENKDKNSDQDVSSKISQLRQLLITQQNNIADINSSTNGSEIDCSDDLQETALNLTSLLTSNSSAFTKTNLSNSSGVNYQKSSDYSNMCVNARRRVSFDILQDDSVPPSPNTRRKNFNFTPISPGPMSPNGMQSKCSSTTVSPFVSPRNTPVPRAKGNVHQNVSTSFIVNQPGLLSIPSTRKPIILPKSNPKIKQETDTHNEVDITNECNDLQNQLVISTEINNYLPMSAPASPKYAAKAKNSNFLQKLLNSNNKVTYSPNYSRSQSLTATMQESLSTEITQLFSKNLSDVTAETNYRSQSVPLHQMCLKTNHNLQSPIVQNSFAPTQFPFIPSSSSIIENDFNDFDTFPNNENINMNKILSTLDSCPNEMLQTPETNAMKVRCNEIPIESRNAYNNVSLDNNLELPDAESSMDFDQQAIKMNANTLPNLRILGRSLSIDIDSSSEINYSMKYNPSRSVPGTPIPCSSNPKVNISKNYRSYPSTPLALNETFSYNHSQDCLLNGQPIKEKVGRENEINQNLTFFPSSESNDEIYNNVDMFNVNDANLNCDILIGDNNKTQYNFDGQLSEGNYANTKQIINNVLDDSCVINGSEFDLKNTSNINGS